MFSILKNFLSDNYKIILFIVLLLLALHFAESYVRSFSQNNDYKNKIDSINLVINNLNKDQKRIDSNIVNYNKKIVSILDSISKIKEQKTTITNIYHAKIDSIDHYDDQQLSSFFTKRYASEDNQ